MRKTDRRNIASKASTRQEKNSRLRFIATVIVFLFAQGCPRLTNREDLTLIVDTHGFREDEVAAGGNQLVEVPQLPLPRPQHCAIADRTIRDAHDVARLVDPQRPRVIATRERGQAQHPRGLRPEERVIAQRASRVADDPTRVVDAGSEALGVTLERTQILYPTVAGPEKRSQRPILPRGAHHVPDVVDRIRAAGIAGGKRAEPRHAPVAFPEDRLDAIGPARIADDLVIPVETPGFAATVARQHADIDEAVLARPQVGPDPDVGVRYARD